MRPGSVVTPSRRFLGYFSDIQPQLSFNIEVFLLVLFRGSTEARF